MSHHSFDIEIAEKHGIKEAIFIQNMKFWLDKCKANNVNIHEGLYWIYNSQRAWHELFPYMSIQTVKTTLKSLKAQKIIITNRFNKKASDTTNWYTFDPQFNSNYAVGWNQPKGWLESTKGLVRTNQTLPYSNPDSNPDNKKLNKKESRNPQKAIHFDEFWNHYPKKTGKKPCLKKWESRNLDELAPIIIADVIARKRDDVSWQDGYIPNPETYINQDRWADEIQTQRAGKQHEKSIFSDPNWSSFEDL